MRAALLVVLALAAVPAIAQPAAPVGDAAAAASAPVVFSSASTAIGTLLDDAAAKAVLDKNVPGLTTNPQIEMARGMTLRDIQSYAAEQLTDTVLKQIDTDLAALIRR